MTKPRRYRRFSSEFKREAITRASEEGMTDKASSASSKTDKPDKIAKD